MDMYGYLRLESMRMLRDVKFAVISLVSPLLMYLVISNGATGPSRQSTIVFLTVTMAAFGAMGAVLNSGSSGLAEDKGLGWLRQLRLTPLRPRDVVLARGLVVMTGALPPILAVQLLGAFSHGVQHTPAQWAAATVALWLGVAPMALLAMAAGYLFRPQIAQACAIVGYVTLSVIGGLWAPASQLPHALQLVSKAIPTGRSAEVALAAATGQAPSLTAIAVLAAWTAAAAALAVLAYRKGTQSR
jgi:ABC-2 type transport system permease protein